MYLAFVEFLHSLRLESIWGLRRFTTLQKAKARLDAGTLHSVFVSSTASTEAVVGADATGFETRHASSHYASRCHLRRAFTKMSAISDTTTQLVGGIVIAHHPVRYDIKYFPELFERMSELANIRTVVLDEGYDAEYIHELTRNAGAISVIPARGDDVPIWHTSGSYRKQMKRNFPEELYGERNKTETIFSVIKRIRGEVSECRDD